MITRTTATRIIIKVNGFRDAKNWLYRILHAGIATCSTCDNVATRIWWNDQAEWVFECPDHHSYEQQWGGSTRWQPEAFSKRVFPDKAQAWADALDPADRARIHFEEFDATDYYALLPEGYWRNPRIEQLSSKDEDWGWFVKLLPLTTGDWVYELEHRSPGVSHGYSMVGAFASADEALEAAKLDENMPL